MSGTAATVIRRGTPWWLGPEGEPGPVMRSCLSAAIAAPSIHNTQPWRFHPRQRGVDVYADLTRHLPVVDPAGRELFISLGAAVLNLRVALRAHGRTPIQQLGGDFTGAQPLAQIAPGPPVAVSEAARALAWAIPRRRTNRWPFAAVAPAREILGDLVGAAGAEGATLRVPGRDARRNLLALVARAERELGEDLAYRHELARWSRGTGRQDGITRAAAGPRPAPGSLPMRDLGLVQNHPRREIVRFEPAPTIAVLHAEDTPEGWLRAGQALQRTLLTATVYGISTTLLTQPLEIPRLRELISDPLTGRPAQAIIRLGYSRRPASPSPRRPLADFLLAQDPGVE